MTKEAENQIRTVSQTSKTAIDNLMASVGSGFPSHKSIIVKQLMSNGIITSADPRAKGVIVDNLIVRNDVIQKRRDDIEGVIKAWFKAVDYMKTNPKDANIIIGRAFGLEPSEVAEMLSGVRPYNETMNKQFLSLSGKPHTFLEVVGKVTDLYYQQRIITNKPGIDELIDTSIINLGKKASH